MIPASTARCPMWGALALAVWLAVGGCAQKRGERLSYRSVRKPANPPAIKHCCDATGHQRGTKPSIFGGTCCCTPSAHLLRQCQADGFLRDYTVGRLASAYAARGIKTDLDHKGCNNLCGSGPHAVKGGHCMATPTPGTLNYEEVITGKFVRVSAKETKSHGKKPTARRTPAPRTPAPCSSRPRRS